jgi:hypothetical protein
LLQPGKVYEYKPKNTSGNFLQYGYPYCLPNNLIFTNPYTNANLAANNGSSNVMNLTVNNSSFKKQNHQGKAGWVCMQCKNFNYESK